MIRSHSLLTLLVFCLLAWTPQAFTAPRVVHSFVTTNTAPSSTSIYSTVLDRPKTIENTDIDKDTEKSSKLGGEGWEIRLFNDPFNKREFVARCLSQVCGKSDTESYQIMMQAHNHGMGVVGRYQFEIAELYHGSLQENGLMVDMVPVDDE
mmetsp:Transcript_107116/g.309792  ORF Transcript_107116/g.309792 Transcript_107116/m.309792 type:complete len:151 (-) Transcript_107116:105-557(-)